MLGTIPLRIDKQQYSSFAISIDDDSHTHSLDLYG